MLPPGSHSGFSGLHLPFVGFTFTTERYVGLSWQAEPSPGPCPGDVWRARPLKAHTQSLQVTTAGSSDFWEGPDSKRFRLCCLCGIVFDIIFNNLKNVKTILSSWEAQKQTGLGVWPRLCSRALT